MKVCLSLMSFVVLVNGNVKRVLESRAFMQF